MTRKVQTVAELVARLQALPQDAEVWVYREWLDALEEGDGPELRDIEAVRSRYSDEPDWHTTLRGGPRKDAVETRTVVVL